MEAKDFVYLGTMILTALLAYWRGRQAGADQSRRVYDKLCDYSRLLTRLPPPGDSPPKASLNQAIWRCGKAHLVKPTIHGVFGIN